MNTALEVIAKPANALQQVAADHAVKLLEVDDLLPVEKAGMGGLDIKHVNTDLIRKFNCRPLDMGFISTMKKFRTGLFCSLLPKWAAVDVTKTSHVFRRYQSGTCAFESSHGYDETKYGFQGEARLWSANRMFDEVAVVPVTFLGTLVTCLVAFIVYNQHTLPFVVGEGITLAIAALVGWATGLSDEFSAPVNFKPGLIPTQARTLIREAIPCFDKVLLVFEADSHTYDTKRATYTTRNTDPLIVGIKSHQAYLLGSFDMTPGEAQLAKEFTT